jgi:predicted HTH transcriptional regulator
VPTVGGSLLFGSRRNEFFPDAWIQAGRFKGVNKVHIADHTEIRSHLPNAVEEAIAFISKHIDRSVRIGSIRRTEGDIPPMVIREAVINAVVHADYSQKGAPIRISIFDDRLEVENPGLLPFGMTVDDLHHGVSKLRNRVIGRTFQALELIEQWGSGIQRMVEACREAGLPPPSFEEIATRFRVTISTAGASAPRLADLDPIDEKILRFVGNKKECSTQEIAVEIARTTRATRDRLAGLVSRGLLREISMGPKDPKKRYVGWASRASKG